MVLAGAPYVDGAGDGEQRGVAHTDTTRRAAAQMEALRRLEA
jgi:hypothetical protein